MLLRRHATNNEWCFFRMYLLAEKTYLNVEGNMYHILRPQSLNQLSYQSYNRKRITARIASQQSVLQLNPSQTFLLIKVIVSLVLLCFCYCVFDVFSRSVVE